jgi:NADPH:quinone reductase-like Zn-dependent oxidoreductase
VKAAVYHETGPPEVLRYEDVPDPEPGPGEILVDVEVVSIEGGDTLNRLQGEMGRRCVTVGDPGRPPPTPTSRAGSPSAGCCWLPNC